MDAKWPLYRCHKIVQAMKIIGVTHNFTTGSYATVENGDDVRLDEEFFQRHRPAAGGYLVRYEDGYLSWSPAKAFEDGYTRI